MKITRRPPPLAFGASNDDRLASRAPQAAAQDELRIEAPNAEAPQAPTGDARRPAYVPAAARSTPFPSAWPIYMTAFVVAVLWALGPIAFAVGYRGATAPLQNDRFAMVVFALLAIGPAALVFGVAFFVRQAQKLAAEADRAREMERTLLTPALRAAAEAGEVPRVVREEIAAAAAAADSARVRSASAASFWA